MVKKLKKVICSTCKIIFLEGRVFENEFEFAEQTLNQSFLDFQGTPNLSCDLLPSTLINPNYPLKK